MSQFRALEKERYGKMFGPSTPGAKKGKQSASIKPNASSKDNFFDDS